MGREYINTLPPPLPPKKKRRKEKQKCRKVSGQRFSGIYRRLTTFVSISWEKVCGPFFLEKDSVLSVAPDMLLYIKLGRNSIISLTCAGRRGGGVRPNIELAVRYV